jgi:hypothetical protein
MIVFHLPGQFDLKTGDQNCARCGELIHHVPLGDSPKKAAESAFSTEVEVCVNPLSFLELGGTLPTNSQRCTPNRNQSLDDAPVTPVQIKRKARTQTSGA